jgi:hypothetical protein
LLASGVTISGEGSPGSRAATGIKIRFAFVRCALC